MFQYLNSKQMHTVHTYIIYTHLMHGSILTHLVYVDDAEGEADVDNDEDEKEDEDVNDHVGHADDDGSSLPPHQPSLIRRSNTIKLFLKKKNRDMNVIGELYELDSV
jgi:hypothetical protein